MSAWLYVGSMDLNWTLLLHVLVTNYLLRHLPGLYFSFLAWQLLLLPTSLVPRFHACTTLHQALVLFLREKGRTAVLWVPGLFTNDNEEILPFISKVVSTCFNSNISVISIKMEWKVFEATHGWRQNCFTNPQNWQATNQRGKGIRREGGDTGFSKTFELWNC